MKAGLTAERWRRIEEVLDVILSNEPHRWRSLAGELCRGDADLRADVDSFLQHAEDARGYLESPPGNTAAALVEETRDATDRDKHSGRRVGPYQIVRELGRGGMSRVFLAERVDGEYSHQVALKLLRPGLDTDIDHARFRGERQILASLNHPNIARLLDGGATDDGVPYFVLEHVDGQPIDEYARARNLTVDQRIELFLTVCAATQYAHRSLVVHRDLKPSNILVNADGVVKLLDFGLAKLLEPSGSPDARVSRTAQGWMTPEYAAPEQIRGDPVTTLTDVYQLGAVLFELLSGEPPFSDCDDKLHALQDAVLRDEPESPSSRVAKSGNAGTAKRVRGDLDAIVLKALRKEPEQRFDSVQALARDLRAHLSGHPVLARRTTASYRVRRFVRRHRVETLATAMISLTLVLSAAFSISGARRAAGERDRAERALRQSDAVSSFLVHLFETSDPAETKGDTLDAGELVRRAAARAERFHGEPAAQARMLEVTGRLYRSLGKYQESYDVLLRAFALRQSKEGSEDLETAATLRLMADALVSLSRVGAADSMAQRALATERRVLGELNPAVGATLQQLANIAVFRGDFGTAERYARHAVDVNQRTLGADDSSTATSHLLLGAVLQREGQFPGAEAEYRRAWKSYERTLGGDNGQVAEAILHVAYIYTDDYGRLADAEPLYRQAIEIRRRAYGDASPSVAYALEDLGTVFSRRGDHAAAVPLARESFDIIRRAYGAEHPIVATATEHLGETLNQAGLVVEAERLFRISIELHRKARGPDSETLAGPETDLAQILIRRGDYRGAEPLIDDAVRVRLRAYGPQHPMTAKVEALRGMLLTKRGAFGAADSVLHHSLELLERQTGRQHPDVREVYGWLADLETARGRSAEASRYRATATAR